MSNEGKGKTSAHRDRYWSVMLVGDHGRVIPFRHFKGLAIGICIAFILMVIAIVAIAMSYTYQTRNMSALQDRLSEIQAQNSKLRDEKDLYMTKLALQQNRPSSGPEKQAPFIDTKQASEEKPAVPAEPAKKAESKTSAEQPEPKPVEKKEIPKFNWMAEIRNFQVSYDANREILYAQFRIYNTSKPKKPLSGRSTIVFKHTEDASIEWLTVPTLKLVDGVPPSDKGQAFQIRNYFTMKFQAYRQKAPVLYNHLTAYVFSEEGKLLDSEEFPVKIDNPPSGDVNAPKPDVTEGPKPQPPVQSEVETPVAEDQGTPSPSTVPGSEPKELNTGPPTIGKETVAGQPSIDSRQDAATPIPTPDAAGQVADRPVPPDKQPETSLSKEPLQPPEAADSAPQS